MGIFRLLCGWSHPTGVGQRQASFLTRLAPTLTSKVAVFPAPVVTAMHGGKRSSPRRHGQEAQRGQDCERGRGRASATIPWGLDSPETGTSAPGAPTSRFIERLLWAWFLIKLGKQVLP